MSELKPCPFPAGEIANIIERLIPEIEAYMELYSYQRSALHGAVSELRRTQPNEPLTLEELRGMGGEPVYVVHKDPKFKRWYIWSNEPLDNIHDGMEGYGLFWWAYRRKPEGGEG